MSGKLSTSTRSRGDGMPERQCPLVSLELDEVMMDRILVMYEGEIVGEFGPKRPRRSLASYGVAKKVAGDCIMRKILKNEGVQSLLTSLICIIVGMFVEVPGVLLTSDRAFEAIMSVAKNFLGYSRTNTAVEASGHDACEDSAADAVLALNVFLQGGTF